MTPSLGSTPSPTSIAESQSSPEARTRVRRANTGSLATAKFAHTTRRVPPGVIELMLTEAFTPAAGDLLLARVRSLGHHCSMEISTGRRAKLFVDV